MAQRRFTRGAGLSALLALLFGFGLFVAAGRAADEERGILADVISRALSTPASRVTIGRIDGALSSNATIHDIAIQDRDGVWLRLDRARIVWRRLALVQRRLEIDDLDLGQLTILRKPIPAETVVAGETQPLLPDLPVKVDVKQFALSEMVVGQPILGLPARFSMGGYGTLGAPSEGLALHLDGQRLDRPASLTVRLALVPDTQKLTLAVTLDEPAGGLVSTLANIPGQPAVTLAIDGDGTLDAFKAHLHFDAGPDIGANGNVTVNREGAGRRLGLDLSARIAGFVPAMAAPVFANTTTLTGGVLFGDDRAVTIEGVALGAAAARLDVAGAIDPAGVADVTVSAANLPKTQNRTDLGAATIRRLAFKAHLTGALSAPTIAATLGLDGAHLPTGSIERLDARFSTTATGSIGDTASLLRFDGEAHMAGLDLANPALAQAVGREAGLTMRGTSTLAGLVDFEALDLKAETLSLHYAGRASAAELQGRLQADAPDLHRFAAASGLDLRGVASLSATLEGTPRSNRFSAVVDATAKGFATGIAALDGLAGGTLGLTGGLRLDPDGGFGFDHLALAGAGATATVDGAATPALADITATVAVPDLAKADRRLSGHAEGTARLTGTLDHPDAAATITLRDATMLRHPVPRLVIAATGTDLRGAPDWRGSIVGDIDRKPLQATLRLRQDRDGATSLEGLDATLGSVALKGSGMVDPAGLVEGALSLKAGDLADLSALALRPLSGSLDADLRFARTAGGQGVAVKATGRRLGVAGAGLGTLAADLTLRDAARHPVLDGTLSIDTARLGDETVTGVRLIAKGTPAASEVSLKASVRGFALAGQARIVPADPVRIVLSRLEAVRGASRIGLAGPASVTIAGGGADLQGVVLAAGAGRLSLDGHVGAQLRLKALARALPLAMADLAVPNLGATGTLEGDATLMGSAAAPTGDYHLRVGGLSLPQTRAAALPPIDIVAAGRIADARATIEASVKAGAAGALTIRGSAPLDPAGALDLGLAGRLDAGVATRTLAAGGRTLTGAVTVEARLAGPLRHPEVSGSATFAGGSVSDAGTGLRLDALTARLVARGDTITIERASATTRDGGPLTASGQVKLDAAAGFPGSVHVAGQNAHLAQSALATAVLNLDLSVTGPLARSPRLGGRIDIVSLDIPVPERLTGRLRPLPGTRHLRPTATAARRLALEADKGRKGEPAFGMGLDLTIAVPGQIRVHGRGLDAELGGGLKLTGTLAQPRPVGAFRLVRGRLQVLTASLDFTRANLTFAGDLSPELDFLASTQSSGATIAIAVTGQPSDPQFDFTSNPSLPQDEILSRLLFGAPAGQLSTSQALSLAAAAAQYSTGGGGDALESLRRSLGLGATGLSNNPLTNALGNRVSVGVRTGVTPAETGVGIDISVIGPLKAKGAVNANGGTSVGLGAEHEW